MEHQSKENLQHKLFISQGTIGGFVVFAIVLTIFIFLEVTFTNPFSSRLTSALLGITIIIFLLGVIIDQLKYRNFRFWALGALVSFLGVLTLFSPVVLYGLGSDDHLIWFFLIGVGIVLVLFGYTIEAYELNNKVAKILINLWENIKNYEWRKVPGKIASLISILIIGTLSYIGLGFKKFRFVIRNSLIAIGSFLNNSIKGLVRLILAIPGYTKKFIIFSYENNYFLIIPLLLLAVVQLVQGNVVFESLTFVILFLLFSFLIIMLLLHGNEELSQRYLQRIRDRSWETLQTISIRIQKTTSSFGRYKCQKCHAPLKLGQETCENCNNQVKHCSICKLPIKEGQEVSTCPHCQYPAHTNHWSQWIRMRDTCPVCNN